MEGDKQSTHCTSRRAVAGKPSPRLFLSCSHNPHLITPVTLLSSPSNCSQISASPHHSAPLPLCQALFLCLLDCCNKLLTDLQTVYLQHRSQSDPFQTSIRSCLLFCTKPCNGKKKTYSNNSNKTTLQHEVGSHLFLPSPCSLCCSHTAFLTVP